MYVIFDTEFLIKFDHNFNEINSTRLIVAYKIHVLCDSKADH